MTGRSPPAWSSIELAIGQIIEPRDGQCLAEEFAGMPSGQAWTEPAPHLVSAALALAAGQRESCAAALDAADGTAGASSRRPAGRRPAGRRGDPAHRLRCAPGI